MDRNHATFQDPAGTTPATRDGDPVGRVDQSLADRLTRIVPVAPSGQGQDPWTPAAPGGLLWWHSGPDLPGALATTGAAHHHGNALARAERHLAGNTIGPKRRRRCRRLLAREVR
jgi:hypothetical protein